MTGMITIKVAQDFSPLLGGRYKVDGPWSGEALREMIEDSLLKSDRVTLDLTGVLGCPQSFLEEVTGGLARSANLRGIPLTTLEGRVEIVCSDIPVYAVEAHRYLVDAIKLERDGHDDNAAAKGDPDIGC